MYLVLKLYRFWYSRRPQRSHWHCNQVFSASKECCTVKGERERKSY